MHGFACSARCRCAWLQHLWIIDGSLDGRATVTHAELVAILADEDSPEAEAQWLVDQEEVRSWQKEAEKIASELKNLSRLAIRAPGSSVWLEP